MAVLPRALSAVGRGLQAMPRRAAWIPVALWLGLIAWLGSWPAQAVGRPGWSRIVTNLGHAPLFGLLALWMALVVPRAGGWPRLDRRNAGLLLLATAACGLGDEIHQHLAARGRDFSLLDMVTDLTGAACLIWVARYVPSPRATDLGILGRVVVGVALCIAAAALATWGPAA